MQALKTGNSDLIHQVQALHERISNVVTENEVLQQSRNDALSQLQDMQTKYDYIASQNISLQQCHDDAVSQNQSLKKLTKELEARASNQSNNEITSSS